MSDKKEPGLTFSIPEIMDTIDRKLDDRHELRITTSLMYFVEFLVPGEENELVLEFENERDLHLWVAKTRIELDEAETEQSAVNDKINHDSANVDHMNQRF